MASADWAGADALQARFPRTYTAMEHLVMAMADAYNNRGKKSLFGYDKGLKSYLKFEEKLKDALIAMTLDGLVDRGGRVDVYRERFLVVLDAWEAIFPNWPDAYTFAYEKIRGDAKAANSLISSLIGVR
jgi:hypothetical protein